MTAHTECSLYLQQKLALSRIYNMLIFYYRTYLHCTALRYKYDTTAGGIQQQRLGTERKIKPSQQKL
jgi:hypothetical protein